jgi:hypothetical protein
LHRRKPSNETIAKEICRALRDCPTDDPSLLAAVISVHGEAKVAAGLAIARERGWLELDGGHPRLTPAGRRLRIAPAPAPANSSAPCG